MGKIFDQVSPIVGWTKREQRLLLALYGTGEVKSMPQVGVKFNVTRTRIWQIQRKALARLFRDDHPEMFDPW